MTEEQNQALAAQLRQPDGEFGLQVGNIMNVGNLHINQNTIKALKLAPNDQVLEIGMGNGFFIRELFTAEESIHYTGLDFSKLMIEEATKINQGFIDSGKVEFHLGGADQMPFAEAIFNKIFTINTLYFWEDQKQVLAELGRVLAPGGILTIAIRPKHLMQDYPFAKYGFRMFSRTDLENLLTAHGFLILNSTEQDEPDQDIAGNQVKVSSVIVQARRG